MNTNIAAASTNSNKLPIDEIRALLPPDELTRHIQQCALNDRQSQKKIYNTFYSFSMSICKRYASNHEDAIEILNDGFLKVFKEIHRYAPAYSDVVGSFRGWVRKIMICVAIDHFRRNKKHRFHAEIDNGMFQVADRNENAFDQITYREIIRSIQKVTPVYRAVLNLFIVEGFTHQEIAKKMGISVGASKSNLAKARIQLQKILSQHNEIEYKKRKRIPGDVELATMKSPKKAREASSMSLEHSLQ